MTSATIKIPARKGKATHVGRGQLVKVINTHGEQVVDMWAFSANDLREYMSMEHSRLHLLKLRPEVGDTLITNRRRSILTLVEPTSPGVHDTVLAACDARRYELLGVDEYHDNCSDNLANGMDDLGLEVPEEPSSFNLFMNIPWTEDGGLSLGEPVTKPGDYVVFRAETDVVVAFSACPQDILPINGRARHPTEAHFQVQASP
jgi:uncharacterized protein YcgI (DUF1989 family)